MTASPRRLVFLGPPGAGKGTQAVRIAAELDICHLATGDMLRQAMAEGSAAGVEATRYLERGELLPDAVVCAMVGEGLDRRVGRGGFVLDGFPRTVAQADWLAEELERREEPLDRVVALELDTEEIMRRLESRRTCRRCQATHGGVESEDDDGICPRCGGELYQRPDDNRISIQRRLEVYEEETASLLDYYEARGLLVRVHGRGTPQQVTDCIRRALGVAACLVMALALGVLLA